MIKEIDPIKLYNELNEISSEGLGNSNQNRIKIGRVVALIESGKFRQVLRSLKPILRAQYYYVLINHEIVTWKEAKLLILVGDKFGVALYKLMVEGADSTLAEMRAFVKYRGPITIPLKKSA